MTKRITAMMTAVVIIITLMLSGCGKQLSMQDYYDQLGANFKEYVAATKDFSSIQTNVTTAAQAEQEKSKAQELCKKAETVLDKFAKMQPPSKYSEKHNELIKSIELEKKFWEASAKIFTAKTDSEISQYTSDAEAVFDGTPSEKQFALLYKDLYLSVKAELEK